MPKPKSSKKLKVNIKDNLEKEDYIIKNNKVKMITKRKLNEFIKNPEDFLKNITDDKLIKFIQDLNYTYYIDGVSLISDKLYDYVKEELRNRNPKHPLLKEIGVSDMKKGILPYYMGSMDKIKNNNNALNNWLKKYSDDNDYVISEKLDGISGLLHYLPNENNNLLKLYTRKGQDISHLIKFINYIPNLDLQKEEIAVRGELIITKTNFIKFQKEDSSIKNIRNGVAGVFNAKIPNLKLAKYIDFVTYDCIKPYNLNPKSQFKKLKKLGFKTAYAEVSSSINIDILSNRLMARREKSEYYIDGIIVAHNKYYKEIVEGNPKHAFAFKSIITMAKAEVLVLKVVWNLTKDDYLQPVVYFEPVEIDGVTIEKATGFNAKFIKDNKIGPGSIILIIRSGDVIPKIEEILKESKEPSMPENYKWKWNDSEIEIILDQENISDEIYKEKKYKELENFVLKIKFDKIGPGLIKKLFDSEINTIDKFLNLTKEDLLEISGIKDKRANNILISIKTSMTDLDCIKLMTASNKLGRGFAEKKLKLIVNEYPDIINANRQPTIEELVKIRGIEKKTAEKFVNNFNNYLEFVKNNNIKCIYNKPKTKNINSKIKDLKIVFTGFRSNELEEYIQTNGGKIQNTVNNETNLLIIKDNNTPGTKIDKANELNIKIITKEEFNKNYLI